MCVLSDCVVRIETGLWVIRFHYVAYSLRPSNVVKYLTTVKWTTRPQCTGDGRSLPWALAGVAAGTSSALFTVYRMD